MKYHETEAILYVMNLLGHTKIESTLVYIHLAKFEDADEFTVRAATNPEGIKDLPKAGFEYVCEKEELCSSEKRK